MAKFRTEDEREIEVLDKVEKRIERRERIHRMLIVGLGSLLALSLAAHVAQAFCPKHRRR